MSACLVCPSWGPCKCESGPITSPTLALVPQVMAQGRASVKSVYTPAPKGRIDIRAKGANGEREVIGVLIPIVQRAMRETGFSAAQITQAATCIQRNQNQSAVGGNDLSHTFGMSFEVKRQEALSVNTWWKQCVAAAKPNNELPVLVYRQNKQSWSVVTLGYLHLPPNGGSSYGSYNCRIEIEWTTFQEWFYHWVKRKLEAGELPRGVDA